MANPDDVDPLHIELFTEAQFKVIVDTFHSAFEEAQLNTFVTTHVLRRQSPVGAEIYRAARGADAAIVILSEETVTDEAVQSEINAVNANECPVLAVIIGQSEHIDEKIKELSLQRIHFSYDEVPMSMAQSLVNDLLELIRRRDADTGLNALETIPAPGAGIHIELNETGVLDFAPPADIDAEGNNKRRLNSLHPEIRDLASSLAAALARSNAFPGLARIAARYEELVTRELEEVDFAQLYALGVRLFNSAAAAQRAIDIDGYPPLSLDADEALQSLLQLHGQFVMASREGLEMLDLEERLRLTPEEVEELRQAGQDLGRELEARPDLATPAVAAAINDQSAEIGLGTNAARGTASGYGIIRNTVISIIATASVVALPIAGAAFGGWTGMVGGGLLGLFGAEAVKKSKAFTSITARLTASLDQLSVAEAAELLTRLRSYLEFVRANLTTMERLARSGEGMAWIMRALRALLGRKE